MNTIQTSLEVLKEASALVEKIPYISPVAGLLLQALKMRDASIRRPPSDVFILPTCSQEVKQYEEEWQIAMSKVEEVAGRVCNIGLRCKQYDLEEKDLPPGLRESFESLQTYVMDSDDCFHWLIGLQ